MGFEKIQKEINKRLKGMQINLERNQRSIGDLQTVKRLVVSKSGEKKEVDVRVDKRAVELLNRFDQGPIILPDKDFQANRNLDWNELFAGDDQSFIIKAFAFKAEYDTLKEKNAFNKGEEEIADNAIAFMQSKLRIMASDIYKQLDPDALYYVPKEVLVNVAQDLIKPKVETAESLLYSSDDNLVDDEEKHEESIDPFDMSQFLMDVARCKEYEELSFKVTTKEFLSDVIKQNSNDEVKYRKEINKGIKDSASQLKEAQKNYDKAKTEFEELKNNPNVKKKELKNAQVSLNELKENSDFYENLNQEYKDTLEYTKDKIQRRRAIVGACLAGKQVDTNGVHNIDEQNVFGSEAYCMGLTGALSDDEINQIMNKFNMQNDIADEAARIYAEKQLKFPPENAEEYLAIMGDLGQQKGYEMLQQIDLHPGKVFQSYEPEEKFQPAEPVDEIAVERQWYESFKKQLLDMGYNNPMAMGLVCVRNDIDSKQVGKLPANPEGAVTLMAMMDHATVPAFVPADPATGVPYIPKELTEDPVEWLHNNSFASPEYVDDAQIKYLYDMAQQNRLFIKSDDFDIERFSKNRYVRVGEDGTAHISKNMQELSDELKANPDAEMIGEYTKEEFLELSKADSDSVMPEGSLDMFADSTNINVKNALAEGKEVNQESLAMYKNSFAKHVGLREAYVNAHKHPDWHQTPEDSKKIFKLCNVARTPEEDLSKADIELRNNNPITDLNFDEIEKGLKKLGYKSVEDAFNKHDIYTHDGHMIDADNSREFASKFACATAKFDELWINDRPFVYSAGYGFKKGVNKDGYTKEINFLIDRLKKTEGNWTSNSPEYDRFSTALKALPAKLNDLSKQNTLDFNTLTEALNDVVQIADDYMDAHKNKTLDSRQTSRVKVMNRLKDLAAEASAKNIAPGKNLDYRLAEKIYTEAAVQNKTPNLLMNPEKRQEGINTIMESSLFVKNFKNLDNDVKRKLLKVSGEKLVTAINKQKQKAKVETKEEIVVNVSGLVK